MNKRHRIAVASALITVWFAACGQWALAAEEAPAIAPQADRVVRAVSGYFAKLESFSVDVVVHLKTQAQERTSEMNAPYTMAVQRPNRLAIVLKRGMGGGTLVCDGSKVYTYIPMVAKYTVDEAPPTLEKLLADRFLTAPLLTHPGGSSMLVAGSLARKNPYDVIMEPVQTARYVGLEEVDGAKRHHIKLLQKGVDWDMWVDAGERPLVRKIVPDMNKLLAGSQRGRAAMPTMKMEWTITFKDWKINPDLPKKTFAFQPPADAEKVDSFFERPELPPHPLEGQSAPEFTLPLLEGGQVDLAAHKGKHVVILDFWASWCGPCTVAMPIITEVAKSYRDKGVVLYAVNEGEKPETIREFLEEHDLDCTVALDADGKVGKLYARGDSLPLPQTVLIGKEGKVQAVHEGLMPKLKQTLTRELDALVAGKDLTAEPEPEQ